MAGFVSNLKPPAREAFLLPFDDRRKSWIHAAMNQDIVSFARPAHLPDVELVSVAYRDRAFPIHMHAEYVVGVVTSGAEQLDAAGGSHIVAAGDVLQLHPGEPHANRTLGPDPLCYRVFYLSAEAIRPWLESERLPVFDRPVLHASPHAQVLTDCHAILSRDGTGVLEQETALMTVVRALGGATRAGPVTTRGGPAIDRVRDFIDAHFADDFGLPALSAVAGLSVFHMARSFKSAVGLSPLAYRNLRRIHEARRRLVAGGSIAAIAHDLGFADQSHLTRQFQKLIGVSPALYRQQ